MVYAMLTMLVLIIFTIGLVGAVKWLATAEDRKLDRYQIHKQALTQRTDESKQMRRLLNRIAREDVGNPALEAQLLLDELDNKYLN